MAGERADDEPVLPTHPARRLYRFYLLTALATLDVGFINLWSGIWYLPVLLGGAGLSVATAIYILRSARGAQLVNAAANQAELGRMDVATRLLDRAKARYSTTNVARGAQIVRTQIELARGNPDKALFEAEKAFAVRGELFARGAT